MDGSMFCVGSDVVVWIWWSGKCAWFADGWHPQRAAYKRRDDVCWGKQITTEAMAWINTLRLELSEAQPRSAIHHRRLTTCIVPTYHPLTTTHMLFEALMEDGDGSHLRLQVLWSSLLAAARLSCSRSSRVSSTTWPSSSPIVCGLAN